MTHPFAQAAFAPASPALRHPFVTRVGADGGAAAAPAAAPVAPVAATTSAVPSQDELAAAYKLMPGWKDGDFAALDRLCADIGCKAEDLLLVLTSESKIDPTAVNRNSSGWPIAVGLNQLSRAPATALGLVPKGDMDAWKTFAEAFIKKPVAEQLPIVLQYYKSVPYGAMGKPYHSPAKLYQANAAPSTMFMGDETGTVLYPYGSDSFTQNKPLWILRKPAGIVFGDLKAATDWHRSNPIYKAAITLLNYVRGQAGPW